MKKYLPKDIEPKWQKEWEKQEIYKSEIDPKKEKKYVLDMFPYPSGDGLHVGHFKGYVATDVISRYYRMRGFNVLHPMGWDAFGLPAENYAIKMGIHPRITTQKNIANIKRQMEIAGLSYDWNREIDTTNPNYYKWTQWIFLKLFEKGLAYEAEAPINWCPKDKTGLANEEVVNGCCERCGTKVVKKNIRQWLLKITAFADRLLEDVKDLDWPEFIKEMQINWIGKKEGINITYDVVGSKEKIEVFTTRPDTNFGATFIALAPENPLVEKIIAQDQKEEVEAYIEKSRKKSEVERKENKEKSGVFTGSYATNQLTGYKMPIWVSDFVLMEFGTGAVVGVPGHDKRDFEFAQKFGLEIIRVVVGKDGDKSPITKIEQVQEEEGTMINSEFLNDLDIHSATEKIMDYMEEKGYGKRVIQYHLRDWIFSRQRYWGEPIPIIHCKDCGLVPVPEKELPLELPEVEKYEPIGTGESPLAAISDWVNTTCPNCGSKAKRETNTMPNWAGSSWYYLRFADSKNNKELISKNADKYWQPVDFYVGGAEHAVLHLLYARFWHKFLFDIGVIFTKEPFLKLRNVGLVLAQDGRKMSKSLGNVIKSDKIVNEYGADTLRVYEGFMGPFDNTISWDPTSINGVYRFLTRVWDLVLKEETKDSDSKIEFALNRLILKIGKDIEQMKFNTAIASMMEFINLTYHQGLKKDQKKAFLKVLAPFAPHITEELWEILGEKQSIHLQPWPEVNKKHLQDKEVMVIVQVNGKVRETIMISSDMLNDRSAIEKIAQDSPKVKKFLSSKKPQKIIYIPGKVINFVA